MRTCVHLLVYNIHNIIILCIVLLYTSYSVVSTKLFVDFFWPIVLNDQPPLRDKNYIRMIPKTAKMGPTQRFWIKAF